MVRTSRPKGPILYKSDETFPIGGSKVLRSSPNDVVTIVAGGLVWLLKRLAPVRRAYRPTGVEQ